MEQILLWNFTSTGSFHYFHTRYGNRRYFIMPLAGHRWSCKKNGWRNPSIIHPVSRSSTSILFPQKHCHIGTNTDSITKQNTAILVQALTLSHNRALPHWYRHWQYHKTKLCHIGRGNDSITKQSSATLVQALTVSHNRAMPHWYRQWQYHTTEHCYIVTGTDSITKQSTATLVQALIVSHNSVILCLAFTLLLCNWPMKTLTQIFWSPVFIAQTLRPNHSPDQTLGWLPSYI